MTECYFIEAGSKGIHFPYFKEKHIAAVDYKKICDFDLSAMTKDQSSLTMKEIKDLIEDKTKKNREQCEAENLKLPTSKQRSCNPITELWNISQVRKGDLIAVTKGFTGVEEFAIATSDYYFAEKEKDGVEVLNNKHRVDVEYLDFGTPEISCRSIKGIVRDADGRIMRYVTEKINGSNGSKDLMSATGTDGYAKTLEDDLNLLFYGPPGTGKTFIADKLAENFVSSHNSPLNVDSELVDEERLVQSPDVGTMTDAEYEQYVREQIQEQCQNEGYTWRVEHAPHDYVLEKVVNGVTIEIRIHVTYSSGSTEDPIGCYVGISDPVIAFLNGTGINHRYIIVVNNSTKNFVVLPYSVEQREADFGEPGQQNWDHTGRSAHHISLRIEEERVELVSKDTNYPCSKFARNIRSMLFRQFVRRVTFHQSYSYEEFVEGIRPNLDSKELTYKLEDGFFKEICHAAKSDPNRDNRYVLLIDEINRGKIPAIFGELITLIDDEKREKYSLNLTYSKERFSVPKNLYIIGTMNTADQSISQLDIALRRRFSHKELMPDATILDKTITYVLTADTNSHKKGEKLEISLKLVLEKINEKIRDDAGREKQIGHAYFMKGGKPISDISLLRDRFENKIIPLIQEYHYEDMKSVHKILGDGFIDLPAQIVRKDWTSAALDSTLTPKPTLDTILDKFAVACDDMTKI